MPSIIPTISAAGLGVLTLQPFPDVTPFTIRSGATYESILSGIRVWLRDELVPYLNDHSAQAIFQDNIDTMIDAVNTALGAQAGTVTAALNAAVDEIVTADVPITSALFGTMGVTIAPPPLGGGQDDTPNLQPLLNAAQATGGTVTLRAGIYLANLATSNSFQQPRILGQGRDVTILKGYSNASPVLRLKGGSGTLSGGYLADFQIAAADAGGGIGLQLADPGGVRWTRLKFTGTLAEGIQFLSESTGGFCEFNTGDAYFKNTVVLPVHYKKISGNESFHGTGLTHGTVIEQAAANPSPMILVDNGCFPYGAPLTVSVFTASGQPVIRNMNTSRVPAFFGHIDIESSAPAVELVDSTQKSVYFHGTVGGSGGGNGNVTNGGLLLADKSYFIGTLGYAFLRPFNQVTKITAATQNLLQTSPGTSLVQVDIHSGGNYHRSYLLHVFADPYSSGGTITQLANPKNLDTNGWGVPTFARVNNLLQVTMPAGAPTDGTVVAYLNVTPFNMNFNGTDQFSQRA